MSAHNSNRAATASTVVICLGSNVPEQEAEMQQACHWLSEILGCVRVTKPYLTIPEGVHAGSAPYLNAVACATTHMPLNELLIRLKSYEQSRGRLPEHKRVGKIIIDVDIVMYGDTIVSHAEFNSGYFQKGYRQLAAITAAVTTSQWD